MANFKLTPNADSILGTSGNDIITEIGIGDFDVNDSIDSGSGVDTLVVNEISTDFLDALTALVYLGYDPNFVIQTAYPNIKNIEKVQFTDAIYTLADGKIEPVSSTIKPTGNQNMTTPFKFTTTTDVTQISYDVLATLTSAQVNTLTKEQLVLLTPDQLGALSVNAVVGLKLNLLNSDTISFLTRYQIAALTSSQIAAIGALQVAGLTVDQISSFTSTQAASFAPKTLALLSSDQIQALSADFISVLPSKTFSALTVTQIQALTEEQTYLITSSQLAVLTSAQVAAFQSYEIAVLNPKSLAGFTKENIAGLNLSYLQGDGQLFSLKPAQFAFMTTEQITEISTDVAGGLSKETISALNSAQIRALSADVISNISPFSIAGLTPKNIIGLSSDQIVALTMDQVSALNSSQIKALTTSQIAAIQPDDISSLAPSAFLGITNFAALQPEQLAVLTYEQIAALSTSQLKQFTSEQANYFNQDTKDWLASNSSITLNQETQALSLSITDIQIKEGDKANSTNATVVLTLDKPATETFTVNLNTIDGTAISGKDYNAVQKTVTFNEGDKSVFVQIPITSDKVFELDENFTVHLDNISSDSVESNNTDATVTILNDDTPSNPTIQHPHTGTISISGKTNAGENLSIQNTLNDADGLGVFSYQWLQNGKAISNATQSTYALSNSDIGKTIAVKVSYTDGLGQLETETSTATTLILPKTEIKTPTYKLTVDDANVDEGETVYLRLTTTNVKEGTEVPFTFSGSISNADALGDLPIPSFFVESNGTATVAIGLNNDELTEGVEKLTATLNTDKKQTVTITVNDTSISNKQPVDVKPILSKETLLETQNPYFVGKDSNADNVRGSIIGDDIKGNIGNDTLKGDDGDDSIDGGNDNDQLFGEEGDDQLKGGAGNDSLDGGAGNDKLEGEAGNDTLNGGLDADVMIGGDGDDNYIVDNQNDVITEATNSQGGNDTASISIGLKWQNNFSRFAGVENFILTGDKQDEFDAAGDDNANKLAGNIGNNRLYGNGGNDTLIGNEGNDTLEGGTGIDFLQGGSGNDTYIVNNEEDTIEDNQGVDTIQSSKTITLSKYTTVETLELTGNESIKGTGNANNNLIQGNDGDNVLSGKGGSDTLKGGNGNDTLMGDAGDDILDGGNGDDTVRYSESQDNYAIKPIDGIYTVINKATGETDQLTDIEFVEFSDGTETLGISNALHLSIADVSIKEGDKANATNATVVLTLDKPATDAFTVDLNTIDGTAISGKDYKAIQKTVTFNEGDKNATVQIPITSDKIFELDENFTAHLENISSDSVELNNVEAIITILNDDKPSLSFATVKITEGQKGKANAEVVVSLSSVISQPVKVHYQTVDGTALKAKDYTATTDDLIIPANTKTAKFPITIIDDKISENTETFSVKFSAPENATLPNNASTIITILDNDAPIVLTGTTG